MLKIIGNVECFNCNKIFRPPFLICRDNHAVCAICNNHQVQDITAGAAHEVINNCAEEVMTISAINELFRNIQDTCQYGCGHQTSLFEITAHEQTCDRNSKLTRCAINGCNWFNIISKLIQHVDDSHPGVLIDLSEPSVDILLGPNNPIILLTQYDKNSADNLIYWLRFHEDALKKYVMMSYLSSSKSTESDSRKLKLFTVSGVADPKHTIKHNILTYTGNIVEEITNNAFLVSSGVCVDVLEGDTYRIEIEKPLTGSLSDSILEHLECFLCNEIMSSQIRMCLTGHSLCSNCSKKLINCPKCFHTITTARNFDLEQLMGNITQKMITIKRKSRMRPNEGDDENEDGMCRNILKKGIFITLSINGSDGPIFFNPAKKSKK